MFKYALQAAKRWDTMDQRCWDPEWKGRSWDMEKQSLEPSLVSKELQQQIAQLAFRLYEARGREDGHDIEDWLRAEAALQSQTILPKASIAAAIYEE